jgi:diguanylate cyclase (GGDEF)-like protein
VIARRDRTKEREVSRSLDVVVTEVATRLIGATAATQPRVSQEVLAELVDVFDVDVSFLRHNDHTIRATKLIAEWPVRPNIPDPDPLGMVYFADADPIFAAAEHGKEPLILRPDPTSDDYQRRVEKGRGTPVTSMASVPLISGDVTTGALGFVKIGDKAWLPEEINALKAIASLFAQLQARVVAEEQLRFLADHDDVTGLHNRRSLFVHLDERLSPGRPGPVATLFFDLDRLKAINDYLGHTAGDQFIRVMSERLRAGTEGKHLIARLGGDEYVVVPAQPTDAEAAEALARKLHGMLVERVMIGSELLARTVSIGVAVGMPGLDTTSDLLRKADQAVLTAKNSGGNKVSVFSDAMSLTSNLRNDIELHLRGVIESGALVLHYLPEVDMRTGEVLAAEALVRWQHPTRGLLMPDAFLSVAESINFAGELGRWIMRNAFAELSRWRSQGVAQDALLRLNISPIQLVGSEFVETVAGMLDEFGLEARSVCLEVTESVVVEDIQTARVTLARLKDVGVQIAIDNFGTGYSVLSQLKSLPVDMLKIDKSFIRELGSNPGDMAIVRAIVALANAFELELIAAGVETQEAAEALLELGCYRAQGYLLSRPLTSEAMKSLLTEGRLQVHPVKSWGKFPLLGKDH